MCAGEGAPSDNVSSLSVTGNSITLTIPVNIVNVEPAVLADWQRSIDRAWNHGNDGGSFSHCGKPVIFDARFTPQPVARPSATSHLVIVSNVKPGEQYVSSVWHTLGTSPSYSPRTGYWASNMDGATSAHEFGHLLGLLDEYGQNDSHRYRDAAVSLMATERGVVLDRHIREIIRMHGGDAALTCDAR